MSARMILYQYSTLNTNECLRDWYWQCNTRHVCTHLRSSFYKMLYPVPRPTWTPCQRKKSQPLMDSKPSRPASSLFIILTEIEAPILL